MQLSGLSQSPALSYTAPRVQEIAYQSHEKLDIAYQDASGQAFSLSIERDVSYYSATYGRSGQLGTRTDSLKKGLLETLQDAEGAVRGFRQLLHRLLRAVDKNYADSFAGSEANGFSAAEGTQLASLSQQSVTITVNTVDADYWSVGNTASRIANFAISLHGGGDRRAHAVRMERSMEEGYRQAADAFGGELPDIARQTVEAARRLLSDWAQSVEEEAVSAPTPQGLDLAA